MLVSSSSKTLVKSFSIMIEVLLATLKDILAAITELAKAADLHRAEHRAAYQRRATTRMS